MEAKFKAALRVNERFKRRAALAALKASNRVQRDCNVDCAQILALYIPSALGGNER